jgi:hypothetical protein
MKSQIAEASSAGQAFFDDPKTVYDVPSYTVLVKTGVS